MGKKTISGKDVIGDMRRGLSNEELMVKYELSAKGLRSLFSKLASAGFVKEGEAEQRLGAGNGQALSDKSRSVEELVADLKAGMRDDQLMQKHKLSAAGLQNLFAKLRSAGRITDADLDRHAPQFVGTVAIAFKCPSCGLERPQEHVFCPRCGVHAEEYLRDNLKSEFEQLQALHEAGILSAEELEEKKSEFFSRRLAGIKEEPTEDRMLERAKELRRHGIMTEEEFAHHAALEKLQELHQAGVLSEQEYEDQKTKLMKKAAASPKIPVNPEALAKLQDLYESGILSEQEFEKKRAALAFAAAEMTGLPRTIRAGFKCPACGMMEPKVFDQCPNCGLLVSKYMARREAEASRLRDRVFGGDLEVFRTIEAGKTIVFNLWSIIFGFFWHAVKGMWLKGLVYAVAFVIVWQLDVLLIHLVIKLIKSAQLKSALTYSEISDLWLFVISAVAALGPYLAIGWLANWDYYLYRVHGQKFFNSVWKAGLFKGFPDELPRLVTEDTIDTADAIAAREKECRKDRLTGVAVAVLPALAIIGFTVHYARDYGEPDRESHSAYESYGKPPLAGRTEMAADLITAARWGYSRKIRQLLEQGAKSEINVTDEEGWTALMHAARRGHVDAVAMLLKAGADIGISDKTGSGAIMLAAGEGHTKIVKMLLDHGAEIDSKDDFEKTALMVASANGRTKTVDLLLNRGSGVNVKDSSGQTALMSAADKGHVDVVRLLIEQGADLNDRNTTGFTALMMAVAAGHRGVVEILLTGGADPNAGDEEGRSALSVVNKRDDIRALLLSHGAREPEAQGPTPSASEMDSGGESPSRESVGSTPGSRPPDDKEIGTDYRRRPRPGAYRTVNPDGTTVTEPAEDE